jgi:hypothetical protein
MRSVLDYLKNQTKDFKEKTNKVIDAYKAGGGGFPITPIKPPPKIQEKPKQ